MAYNTPGYIDVTQSSSPLRQDEHPIMTGSECNMSNSSGRSPRYPHCIVWTPIPFLTWLMPFIGHMGICTSTGVIRDFAGSYYVSEDHMAFGDPTRYIQMYPEGPSHIWDTGINDAVSVYKTKMHTLCWNNCHSMVAMALNNMKYKDQSWNAWKLGIMMAFCGKFVSFGGVVKTFLPFIIIISGILLIFLFAH